MKRGWLIAILILSNSAVVAVSLGTLRRSRNELVDEFDAVQQRLTRETATLLAARLSALDRDGALLATLVQRTRQGDEEGHVDRGGERAWKDQAILSACQAMATTVSHYRTIGVFGRPGAPPIVATDPTEDRSRTNVQLLEASATLAREVNATRHPAWRGPLLLAPTLAFYLYGTPAGRDESLVITVDVGLLLEDVLRIPKPGTKYLVTDAGSTSWIDCESTRTCTHVDAHASPLRPRSSPLASRVGARGRVIWVEAPAPASSTIDRFAPAAAAVQVLATSPSTTLSTQQAVTTPLGVWSLTLESSTAAIDARQHTLSWQLMLTSLGVMAAMLFVGIFIMRQQRASTILEVELKAARQLADLRERSDKILDNVSVGVLGATRSGKVVFANRFFSSGRFPAAARHAHGEGPSDLSSWTERLRPDIERALAHGRTGLISAERSNPDRKAEDGALDVRVVPLSHPVENVEALILVEDLSELHELRRQLVRAEKLITVGVLSAGIAHEVGTPLMVIRGHAEVLLEKITTPAAVQGLEAIIAQIDRITATIRNVLEFSRAQPTQVRPTSLGGAISQATELLGWRFRSKGISVLIKVAPDLPSLAADPLQLEQLLVNLLMNACDASGDAQPIDISGSLVSAESGAGPAARVRIEIVDRGTGIRPEHIHAVFDPYFTTKKAGEGTGLGLTIVSQIVHSHRGEIKINSALGRGTTVSLLWPTTSERERAHA